MKHGDHDDIAYGKVVMEHPPGMWFIRFLLMSVNEVFPRLKLPHDDIQRRKFAQCLDLIVKYIALPTVIVSLFTNIGNRRKILQRLRCNAHTASTYGDTGGRTGTSGEYTAPYAERPQLKISWLR